MLDIEVKIMHGVNLFLIDFILIDTLINKGATYLSCPISLYVQRIYVSRISGYSRSSLSN